MVDYPNDKSNDSKKQITQGKSKTPVLDSFCTDLTKLAETGLLEPCIGQEDVINRIFEVLSRKTKGSPILLGFPGSGKTTIVEKLADKLYRNDCPISLINKRIYQLDLNTVISGTKYRGQFEERMKAIIDELVINRDVIVFIDEVHTIIGTGNASNGLDVGNIIKPYISRGDIQIIGATTHDEYMRTIGKDSAMDRRFQKITIEETSYETTVEILNRIKYRFEEHHNVTYSSDIIDTIVKLSDRYITGKYFPDKAIDVLDECGAKTQMATKFPKEFDEINEQIQIIKKQKHDVVKSQQYEMAAELRIEEKRLQGIIDSYKMGIDTKEQAKEVNIDTVYSVITSISKVKLGNMSSSLFDKLSDCDKILKDRIVGQDEAIDKIISAVKRNSLGVRKNNKPSSFIMVGPTGVGKSMVAKELALNIFGDASALIRFDMSEFAEKFTASRLIGSAPGYIGFENGGELTEQVRNKPYSVVLFDEIEKAHPDIYNLLLQIMDEGFITDNHGKKTFFKNNIIIMTSNVGVKKSIDFKSNIGFSLSTDNETERERSILDEELKKHFKPEFLNRISHIVYFNKLTKENCESIVKIELNYLVTDYENEGFKLSYDDKVVDHIVTNGFDEKYGARNINRYIETNIEDRLTDKIISGDVVKGKKFKLGNLLIV